MASSKLIGWQTKVVAEFDKVRAYNTAKKETDPELEDGVRAGFAKTTTEDLANLLEILRNKTKLNEEEQLMLQLIPAEIANRQQPDEIIRRFAQGIDPKTAEFLDDIPINCSRDHSRSVAKHDHNDLRSRVQSLRNEQNPSSHQRALLEMAESELQRRQTPQQQPTVTPQIEAAFKQSKKKKETKKTTIHHPEQAP